MAGYTRQAAINIVTGGVIDAADFNNEFDAIESALSGSTGHSHDGTSGEGAPIQTVGPSQDVVITSSAMRPKTTNTVDLGTSSLKFKNVFSEAFITEDDGDLHVKSNVVAYSSTISDERLKKDIQKIEGALDKVDQINGYTFVYNNDGKKSAGVIAQEVEKVLPSAVQEKKLHFQMDGDVGLYKTVQYDQLHGLLIEAIKELKAEIEELKNGSSD